MRYEILIFCFLSVKPNFGDLQADIPRTIQDKTATLSRQRRYLAFPEGSSLQMIFDLTYPSVATMGDLIQFGHTAVMAWKLPTEPIFLDKNLLKEVHNETKMDDNHGKIKEDNFRTGWQVPMNHWDDNQPYFDEYDNKFWTQNYQKSPYYGWNPGSYNRRLFYDSRDYHYPSSRYENLPKPQLYHKIHRRTRRDLYQKIEKLFTAFKKDGKACLLKAICQFTQFPEKKGSLIVEILKAIFRPRPYHTYPEQDHYDVAANPKTDCEKIFPTCKGSILSHIFVNKIKK